MRYSLRTLLMVVTVFSLVIARVSYLKHQRDYHRREVQKLIAQLSALGNSDRREMEGQVRYAAEACPRARGTFAGGNLPGEFGSPVYENTLTAWHIASQHELLANRYSRAIYRPWAFVWDDPNSVPDKVLTIDWSVCATAGLAAGLAFGLGWWFDNRRRHIQAATPNHA
jgi:hypothetical protein